MFDWFVYCALSDIEAARLPTSSTAQSQEYQASPAHSCQWSQFKFHIGHKLEYHSKSLAKWIEVKVIEVGESGTSPRINVHETEWYDTGFIHAKRNSQGQLLPPPSPELRSISTYKNGHSSLQSSRSLQTFTRCCGQGQLLRNPPPPSPEFRSISTYFNGHSSLQSSRSPQTFTRC